MGGLSGPMFEPSEDEWRKSCFGKMGGHYNVFSARCDSAMSMLRHWFPDGKANEMNFVLFSTSGVHGSYRTLEEIETGLRKYPDGPPPGDEGPDDYCGDEVTFLLVQPRIVGMTYGNARVTVEDVEWLKGLRQSSWDAACGIGKESP